MEYINKIVEFSEYCKTCKHEKVKEEDQPCCDCLAEATNVHSRKPIKYESKNEE